MGLVWSLGSAARGEPQAAILQSFEDATYVPSDGSVLLKDGQATDGNTACQLAAGASIAVKLQGRALLEHQWLKVDTRTTAPVPANLVWSLQTAGSTIREVPGYVAAGKDTLALPLSALLLSGGPMLGSREVSLVLANPGPFPVVVDAIRLEASAAPPAGSYLVDWGPVDQILWPGFQPAIANCTQWSSSEQIISDGGVLPDPLGCDWRGAIPSDKVNADLTIKTIDAKPGHAWVWLTHFRDSRRNLATAHGAKVGGSWLVREELSARQRLGSQGALLGLGGPWTQEWLSQTYARCLVEKIDVPMRDGEVTLALVNSQVAALAVAPQDKRREMEAYLQQVQADLDRYRRQFIVGVNVQPRSTLAPDED